MNRTLRYMTIFLILLNTFTLIALYAIAYRFDSTQRSVRQEQKILDQEESIGSSMQAEWAYLNRPDTLAKLAKQYLGMRPTRPEQYKTLKWLSHKAEMTSRSRSRQRGESKRETES